MDIPALPKTKRVCQKPVPLLERLVLTHSNQGDLVVDPFAGFGTTGIAAIKHNRSFRGCDSDTDAVLTANKLIASELANGKDRQVQTQEIQSAC